MDNCIDCPAQPLLMHNAKGGFGIVALCQKNQHEKKDHQSNFMFCDGLQPAADVV
jgi:hypothetical protein